jgi:hypothetical protein
MKRLLWFAGAVAVAASLVPRPAQAQFIGGPAPYVPPTVFNPFARPVFSPYLGLGLAGNRGINYAGFVVPQLQQGIAVQQLEGQALLTQQQLLTVSAANTRGVTGTFVTGHPFGFQTQYAYFQNTPVGTMVGGTGVGSLGVGVGRGGLGGLYGGGLGTGLSTGVGVGVGIGTGRTGAGTGAAPQPPPKK